MAKLEALLISQAEMKQALVDLKHLLLGEEHEKGFIPRIEEHLALLNDSMRKQNGRLIKVETKMKIILWGLGLVVIPSGSLAATLTKIWGIW